jgi:2-methylisocitrate lyase-like PEP mutase family enzyme
MTDQDRFAGRRARFRSLHERGCFVIPNPWDIGSARFLAHLGFQALASTSSGFAFSRGVPDMGVPVEQVLAHLGDLVGATDLPVNADFEDGHAATEEELADNIRRCVATGVAGLSIEDATGRKDQPLYRLEEAVDRMRAARRAIDATGTGVVLVGRAECFLTGHPDPLQEAIRRLAAYAEAGADCLYAPGLRTREEISAVVRAVSPRPVNVLVGKPIGLDVADLAALGVRRVSIGGALAGTAWGGLARAARALAAGSFEGLSEAMPHAELTRIFTSPAG